MSVINQASDGVDLTPEFNEGDRVRFSGTRMEYVVDDRRDDGTIVIRRGDVFLNAFPDQLTKL